MKFYAIMLKCLPHARGGVSMLERFAPRKSLSSPRSWGCFHRAIVTGEAKQVFPTLVGVFP